MASYLEGEGFLGKFAPGLFSWKLAKKTAAKFDPTASKAQYGGYVKAGLATAGAVAAGILTGGVAFGPVFGAIYGGVGVLGQAQAQNKSVQKQKKLADAAKQQAIIQDAMAGKNASNGTTTSGPKKPDNSGLLPILGIGAGIIAALAF